ncbi:MAG: hypothetical protein WA160_16165 [Pseudobdellovibrio sp.]
MKLTIKLVLFSLLTVSTASFAAEYELTKQTERYETHLAEVYSGETGKSLPFKVTVTTKTCEAFNPTITKVKMVSGPNDVYLIKNFVFSDSYGRECIVKTKSRSFELEAGKGFAELLVPEGFEITIEKSETNN